MTKLRNRQAAQIDHGTEQTRGRLREGTLSRLIRTGKIGSEEQRAADEIEAVYKLVGKETAAKIMNYGERLDKGTDADPKWFTEAYKRYRQWAMYFNARKLAKQRDAHGMDICITIIADPQVIPNEGQLLNARDIDRYFRWKSGTAAKILIQSLRLYAINAGWVRGELLQTWAREAA